MRGEIGVVRSLNAASQRAFKNERIPTMHKGSGRLPPEKVREVRRLRETMCISAICSALHLSECVVKGIVDGLNYKHVK